MSEARSLRLAAVIAADVAGYSRLMGQDQAATLATLRQVRADLVGPAVARQGGRIIKSMGDGWLIEFASVVNAVSCAIEIQEGLAGHATIRLRVGLHLGDIAHEDEDIFGSGVNIAARLQEIARPGSIVISDMARRCIDGDLAAAFGDLGVQHLKNIAEPVRVYGWGASSLGKPSGALPLPEKPSIAVLPFENMSGDPEQDFFADGITEDIISGLSRFSDLFVIARNSAFTFKGSPAKAQDIGRDLGVRYLAEGSVRKAGTRVRTAVQLIDATTGAQLWADRYDRELVDMFDLQDEITGTIVGILPGRLRASEAARFERHPPADMRAYDYLLAARILHHRATREDNGAALELLDKALALDRRFAEALAWKACTLGQALDYGFCDDPGETLAQAASYVREAMAIDEHDVECLRLICEGSLLRKDLGRAKLHADRALALNPNDPRIVAQQGEILTWQGRAEEGLAWLEKSFRLDPFNSNERAHLLGRACYACRRYDEAIEHFARKTKPRPGHLAEYAASFAQAGQPDRARAQADAELAAWPDFSISGYVGSLPFTEARDRDHLSAGMLKAGLPD